MKEKYKKEKQKLLEEALSNPSYEFMEVQHLKN